MFITTDSQENILSLWCANPRDKEICEHVLGVITSFTLNNKGEILDKSLFESAVRALDDVLAFDVDEVTIFGIGDLVTPINIDKDGKSYKGVAGVVVGFTTTGNPIVEMNLDLLISQLPCKNWKRV